MGQAKQRGSFEQRKAEGIAKKEAREKAMAEIRAARLEMFKNVRPEQTKVTLHTNSKGGSIAKMALIQALMTMTAGNL